MSVETIAILANVAEYAGYVETILSAIKTAKEVFGQPEKTQDESTRVILGRIAEAEEAILERIDAVEVKGRVVSVREASVFWGETWLFVVQTGITYETVGPNGALHGTEELMGGYLTDLTRALTYLNEIRETLPANPEMLKILLDGYSLYMSMQTVWEAFTWVRILHDGNTAPPKGLLAHANRLKLGKETVEAWQDRYLHERRTTITYSVEKELWGDETAIPRVYDFQYFVQADGGADEVIEAIEVGTFVGSVRGTVKVPPADWQIERIFVTFLRKKWDESANGAKAVAEVFGHWQGLQESIGLLLN